MEINRKVWSYYCFHPTANCWSSILCSICSHVYVYLPSNITVPHVLDVINASTTLFQFINQNPNFLNWRMLNGNYRIGNPFNAFQINRKVAISLSSYSFQKTQVWQWKVRQKICKFKYATFESKQILEFDCAEFLSSMEDTKQYVSFLSHIRPDFDGIYLIFTFIIGVLNAASAGLGLLQYCNLNSFRTKFIIGFSFFMGLSVPRYFSDYVITSGHSPVHTHSVWVRKAYQCQPPRFTHVYNLMQILPVTD